ncbi:hypothetical protein, partial [Xanthomonas phaseoli]
CSSEKRFFTSNLLRLGNWTPNCGATQNRGDVGGMGDRFGIDISFGNPNHSEYYTAEHKDEKGLRLVTFQMNEKFWSAIKYLKKIGKEHDHTAGKRWLEGKKSLKAPAGSDCANLDSFTKKTSLHFEPAWLPYLLTAIEGVAAVEYLNKNEALPSMIKDDDGKLEFMGFNTLEDIHLMGGQVDEDGWGKTL